MKAKLLRKIRSRFEVFYYPNKESYNFEIIDNDEPTDKSLFWITEVGRLHSSKQSAIDGVLIICRYVYHKHTRSYKLSQLKRKVWHM